MPSLRLPPADGLPVAPKDDGCAFISVCQFEGPKEGFVFQTGAFGLGYYGPAAVAIAAAAGLDVAPANLK
jgi:hypothetical protein